MLSVAASRPTYRPQDCVVVPTEGRQIVQHDPTHKPRHRQTPSFLSSFTPFQCLSGSKPREHAAAPTPATIRTRFDTVSLESI